ncbi:hypothetical protein LTS17_009170 [Exophiala oligosperma]
MRTVSVSAAPPPSSPPPARREPEEEEGDLRRMTMQIHALMEKVDSLQDKLAGLSPSSLDVSHAPFWPGLATASMQATDDQANLCDLPTDAPPPPPPPPPLWKSPQAIRDESVPPDANDEPEAISPEYHGPTSSEFTFEVANESLTQMGVGCSIHKSAAPVAKFFSFDTGPTGPRLRRLFTRDRLWTIDRTVALSYIEKYHNTVGAMYPVTDEARLAPKVQYLFDAWDANRNQRHQGGLGSLIDLMLSIDIQIIKIQVAVGMINVLGVAGMDVATELVQSVLDSSDDSMMNLERLGGVQLLVCIVLFYYNLDDEVKASRYSCLASRRCLEMGLHRRDMLAKHFPEAAAQKQALRVFWSVFTLDRRSSLGLGVPFVIQDSLVDPTLLSIDFDHAYLRSMVPFAKLSGKAWQMGNDFTAKEPDAVREEIDYLDYQVLQWQKQIPASLSYQHHSGSKSVPIYPAMDGTAARDTARQFYLSVVLFARANQLRNVIYRPLLQSASRIQGNLAHTSTALNIARDSIRAFSELDEATDLLGTHAAFFKHFIVSSLGNLLLILVHSDDATGTEYWTDIRETFHVASVLMRKLSVRSGSVLRAWDRLKGLEDLQAKIMTARRRKAEAKQQGSLNSESGVIEGMGTGEQDYGERPSNNDDDNNHNFDCFNNILDEPSLIRGGDCTLFDSQIRNDFAGFLDPAFAFTGPYDVQFFQGGGGRNQWNM